MVQATMERSDRRARKEKKHPRVPIKTYHWEDIRRSRRKGGYPWTHLYKKPFDEVIDVESFTMEGLRKSRSSSTIGRHEGVEISEVTSEKNFGDFLEAPEKMDTLQLVTDPDDHSSKHSHGSLNIEECEVSDTELSQKQDVEMTEVEQLSPKDQQSQEMDTSDPEQAQKAEGNIGLESAESSDNISQYLDKEERGPGKEDAENSEESAKTKVEEDVNVLKPEEETRKRKLSAESSYSRISQTKMAVLQKLKEARSKIKVPKLTFSTSKSKRSIAKKKSSPQAVKKEAKKSQPQQRNNNTKPVYIHIPLKPPEGTTDEFSYLEFAEKTDQKPPAVKKPSSFKELVKKMKESNVEPLDLEHSSKDKKEDTTQEKIEPIPETNDDNGDKAATSTDNSVTTINKDTSTNPTETEQTNGITLPLEDKIILPAAIIPELTSDVETEKKIFKIGTDNSSMEEIPTTPEEDAKDPNEIFDDLFKAGAGKQHKEPTATTSGRQMRSKSEEPERKRKLSMESSYSRKSLSKLGIMKKLREAGEKIKKTFSKSNINRQSKEKKSTDKKLEEKQETKKETKAQKQLKAEKQADPVYIHIPLKPDEGELDQFSKPTPKVETSTPNEDSGTISSTPDSIQGEGVQFIYLTPPSDDEILDYNSSDVPETPSSENKRFFANKIGELKMLAKDAVDGIALGKKKLAPVSEEANGDKTEEVIEENALEKEESAKEEEPSMKEDAPKPDEAKRETGGEKITIDVEDGLSESTVVKHDSMPDEPQHIEEIAKDELLETKMISDQTTETKSAQEPDAKTSDQPLELKSSLKGTDSPVMKKKVSFKRRSRTPKDGIYEEVKAPDVENKGESDAKQLSALGTSQSMSVDEEKTYLDEKIIKTTSLEEDYNKWSQINDHEYEPVNPPPDDETFLTITPAVHLTDINNESTSLQPIGTVVLETPPAGLNMAPREDLDQRQEVTVLTRTTHTNATEESVDTSACPPEKPKEGPSKFQQAFKQKTDQFKNKIHNMKRPHITMPKKPTFQKPNFQKFKIEKPNFHLPKIPDTARINLPFSLPRKNTSKRTLKQRQLSTESNDGDSKKPLFDFSTYPRIFKKKPKVAKSKEEIPEFATQPRPKKNDSKPSDQSRWSGSDSVRIPLHSEDSTETPNGHGADVQTEGYDREDSLERRMAQVDRYDREDSPERRMARIDRYDREDSPERMARIDRYDREDSLERRMASHIRYDDDIDIDDESDRENVDINKDEYLSRWGRGNFQPNQEELKNFKNSEYKVTDLDSPDIPEYNSNNKENFSSGSSLGVVHRTGVLEEINSDEFFLRQKGISQDNIDVGKYLSSEIREAFRMPDNALAQMQDFDNGYDPRRNQMQDMDRSYDPRGPQAPDFGRGYDPRGSNQSLPEVQNKRKPVKKPKRKKTPHTSQERIPYFEESADDDLDLPPPARPKRRSKKSKKPSKQFQDVVPHQETISIDTSLSGDRFMDHRESLGGILGDDEGETENINYENEMMQGKDHPEVFIIDPYKNFQFVDMEKYRESFERENEKPEAPPRKQKSVKSLNGSESELILGNHGLNKDIAEPQIEVQRAETRYNNQVIEGTPKRPSRQRSRTSLLSREPSVPVDENFSQATDPYQENQVPCVEEPCVQDIRDYMGYAIVDKQKQREPPLPPPRTPPRRKRSIKSNKSMTPETKFFTVPRTQNEVPVRPLRNYSTLGQMKKTSDPVIAIENKENIDIRQYIEIDDEPNRDLHSGDVIKKMKDRPLPPPPRPPRKSRSESKPLRDITSQKNIISEPKANEEKIALDETEVSTQTEPLPSDFVCEEVVQEPTDTILSPSKGLEKPVRRHLITPTRYTHEETITHGSLVVEPLNGAKILQDSEITKMTTERIIPVSYESDFDETSSIPEDFKKLKDPPQQQTTPHGINPEMDVVKAHKLQVSDLDIDTLTVNKLLAGKIVVSEIDSSTISANEIGSKSGSLKVGEIELPPEVIKEIVRSLKAEESDSCKKEEEIRQEVKPKLEESSFPEQKKTPVTVENDSPVLREIGDPFQTCTEIEEEPQNASHHQLDLIEYEISQPVQNEPPQPPPRGINLVDLECQIEPTQPPDQEISEADKENAQTIDTTRLESSHEETPDRPPRQSDRNKSESTSQPEEYLQEPDIDDEPPPRPPQPQVGYIPSQPPPSFYALRAQKYVDNVGENIPVVPRRRRQAKAKPITRSSSEESISTPISRRFASRLSEPSIPELSGQLIRACGVAANNALKRLITHITSNVLRNEDGQQDMHVMVIILLVLIAGLILLGYGDDKTVVHMHHWEYFNPPRDM